MSKAEQIARGKKFVKTAKIILLIFLCAVVLLFIACSFIVAYWCGCFNFMFPHEVATYNSPDGEYSLVFEQNPFSLHRILCYNKKSSIISKRLQLLFLPSNKPFRCNHNKNASFQVIT